MKPANFGSIIAKLIAAVMLFAALGRHAYDYYTLLRWVACGVCAYTAFQAMQTKRIGWLWVFVIAALVLNPIAPLHLKRETGRSLTPPPPCCFCYQSQSWTFAGRFREFANIFAKQFSVREILKAKSLEPGGGSRWKPREDGAERP